MKNKRADTLQTALAHILIIGFIATIFFISNAQRIDNRFVRQQIIEKQIALFIDSAIPGMEFTIMKMKEGSYINKLEIKDDYIYATVNSLPSAKGYPIFSPYSIQINQDEWEYRISITK